MKITFEVLGFVLLLLVGVAAVRFFLQRRREQKAQDEGVVVYATVVSVEPVGGLLGKLQQPVKKITLRVQEPGQTTPHEVVLRTRVDTKQKLTAEMRLPVVIDPKDPERVYPANAEAAKRAVITGSRMERRQLQSQLRSPGRPPQRPPSGYQPPPMRRR